MISRVILRGLGAVGFTALAASGAWWLYLEVRPLIDNRSAQHALWSFYQWAGWWWWGIGPAMSLLGFWYLLRLFPPACVCGIVSRILLGTGFLLWMLCPANNALGPLAGYLVMAGSVMQLRLIAKMGRAVARPAPPPQSLSHRVLQMLAIDA